MNTRIMVIVAHPDDAELYAYGIMHGLINKDCEVRLLIITSGDAGNGVEREVTTDIRKKEALSIAESEGWSVIFGCFRDGEVIASLELRKFLIQKIREFKPSVILTHRDNDYHPDHRYLSTAIQDSLIALVTPAICPQVAAINYTPIVMFFWNRFQNASVFKPSVLIGIDGCIEKKLKCLSLYKSQFPNYTELCNMVYGEANTIANMYGTLLEEKYGTCIRYAEALELCEYAKINELIEFEEIKKLLFDF